MPNSQLYITRVKYHTMTLNRPLVNCRLLFVLYIIFSLVTTNIFTRNKDDAHMHRP